jgi:teichuronic acid biosynthesis glycosyltransferase TuaG
VTLAEEMASAPAPPAPTFSVVIPTHQSRDLVVVAIRSVLAQTDPDFEIIVIDNGSTDGTDAAVEAMGDSRITYRWQEDSGLPADSRNKGIDAASGEWVAFLDADDTWRPEKLDRVCAVLVADPGIDAVCHDVEIVDATGARTGERAYRLDDRPIWEQLFYRGNFLSTSAMTVRTEVLRSAGGFDTRADYFTVEDYDLWLRLAENGARFTVVPETLGSYLVHPGGASNRLVRHYDALMRVFDDHAVRAALRGALDSEAALARRRRSRLAEARDLARRGSVVEALRVLLGIPRETIQVRGLYRAAAGNKNS